MSLKVDENIKRQVAEMFKHMEKAVIAKIFLSDERCFSCNETLQILNLLGELAPKEKLIIKQFKTGENDEEIKAHNVDRFPTVILNTDKNINVRFAGIFSGYEFGTMVEDILDLSLGKITLDAASKDKITSIDKPMHIMVFVTPTCPYCPAAVRLAHKAAMLNESIIGEMVEAQEFPELSNKFHVMGVPRTVINDGKVQYEGALPENVFVEKLLEAYKKM